MIVSQKPVVGVGLLGGIRPPIVGLPRELAMAEHVGSSLSDWNSSIMSSRQ